MANKALHYCGNCGKRIRDNQTKLEIRVKRGTEFYHETWQGCYESTRDKGVVRTEAERNIQLMAWHTHI
jgi:hypothetical protein